MYVSRPVAIALGSNLGPRVELLARARGAIAAAVAPPQRVSRIFETDPIGPPQPRYLNQVVLVASSAEPEELLAALLGIEAVLGRDRAREMTRGGPRRIDCDLLLCGALERETPRLILPHPRLHQRAFVLVPLAEVLPDWRHPRQGATVAEMLERVGCAGVRPWTGESSADGSGPLRSSGA